MLVQTYIQMQFPKPISGNPQPAFVCLSPMVEGSVRIFSTIVLFHAKSTNEKIKNQTPFNFHGPYQETFSHQTLTHFIGLPLSYDHLKVFLKILSCLCLFNKMLITLLVTNNLLVWIFEILIKFSFR